VRHYQVTINDHRTLASVDEKIAEYLSLHLGVAPNTPEADSAIEAWAQAELDSNGPPGPVPLSQWLLARALLALVRPDLVDAWKTC